MKKYLLLLLPFILLIIAYFVKHNKNSALSITSKNTKIKSKKCAKIENELKTIDSVTYFENYVIDVINNGSNKLNFPSGAMDGGYVSPIEAKKIAAFMATLQGYKPTHPEWIKEGELLFNGNCTGCHGIGGKGQKGSFPNLRRKPLLGIELIKKEFQKN